MGEYNHGYRLRSINGDVYDSTMPLQVDSADGKEKIVLSTDLNHNGKASAGVISVSCLPVAPIIEVHGKRVASYWGKTKNLVYEADIDSTKNTDMQRLLGINKANGSASCTVYDSNHNLEDLFESPTGTIKRFIVKITDYKGVVLYGWVMGVSASSHTYILDIYNDRKTEIKNWVGDVSEFNASKVKKLQVYHYNSSLSLSAGSPFNEEVDCPREYSKSRKAQLEFASGLSNGQYFVDYWRGEIIGKKSNTSTTEKVTYNTNQLLGADGGGGGSAAGGSAGGGNNTYSTEQNDFTATVIDSTRDIELSVDNLAGEPITEANFANAILKVYVAATGEVKTITLDKFVWDGSTKVLDVTDSTGSFDFATGDIVSLTLVGLDKQRDVLNNAMIVNPIRDISDKFTGAEILNLVNIPANTTGFVYFGMDGFKEFALQNIVTSSTDTLTLTVEATWQDDGTVDSNCVYVDVTKAWFGVDNALSDIVFEKDVACSAKYVRLKYVTSDTGGNNSGLVTYLRKQY